MLVPAQRAFLGMQGHLATALLVVRKIASLKGKGSSLLGKFRL